MKFNNEQLEFLKENINKYPKSKLIIMFDEKFGIKFKKTTFQKWCNYYNIKPTEQYQFHHTQFSTIEQREWLIKNHSNYDNYNNKNDLITKDFNNIFNTNYTKEQIRTRLRTLKLCKSRDFTSEEKQWLKENVNKYDMKTLTDLFNDKFNSNRKINSIQLMTNRYGLRETKTFDYIPYNEEEIKWIKEHYDEEDNTTLYEKFNKKFNRNLTYVAFSTRCKKIGIKKEKFIPYNKINEINVYIYNNINNYISNNKIDYNKIKKDVKEKFNHEIVGRQIYSYLNKRMDMSGFLRQNNQPIGYEFLKDGIWYIKISNEKYKGLMANSMLKNRYLYEKYHNYKLKDDELIIHLDNDKNNFDKENLIKLNRNELGIMNGNNFFQLENIDLKKCAILYSQIQAKLKVSD